MLSDKLNFFPTPQQQQQQQQQHQTIFSITLSSYTEHFKEVITQDIFCSVMAIVSSEI
jgi:hypothetical protein